ncbi:MAG TPA: hypothetical protein VNR40_02425, partial [Steroidobacter sp.]|nr:hypothetical protein [Steroidobacter sp.]
MSELSSFAQLPLFNNSALDWLFALGIAVAVLLVLLALRRTVRAYHKKMLATAQTELLEIPMQVLSRTTLLLLLVVSLYVASQWLTTGPKTQQALGSAITIVLFWQVGIWAVAAVSVWLDRKRQRSLAVDRAA